MDDRTGLDGTTLPASTVSYGERTQTHTIGNHASLLAYLAS